MIAYDFAESDSYEHGVGEAPKRHPNTIVKWLLAKVNEKTPQYSYGFSQEADDLISLLPHDQRNEVIRQLPNTARAQSIAARLVNGSRNLF